MNLRARAIFLSAREHGETAIIARLFTPENGVIAAYIAGGRGRDMRPIAMAGNIVDAELRSKSENQLPFARLELVQSRGPWLGEPLAAAAITWVAALTASTLPERNPYPALYSALEALLSAICNASAAREWLRGLIVYEALMLRDLGYGGSIPAPEDDIGELIKIFGAGEEHISRYLLAENRGNVMGARTMLNDRLRRILG